MTQTPHLLNAGSPETTPSNGNSTGSPGGSTPAKPLLNVPVPGKTPGQANSNGIVVPPREI